MATLHAPFVQRPTVVQHAMANETQYRKLAICEFMQTMRIIDFQSQF